MTGVQTCALPISIFSVGEGAHCNNSKFGQQFNSFVADNTLRVKAERLPDSGCQNNLFPQQFGQEDLMSALLKQVSLMLPFLFAACF